MQWEAQLLDGGWLPPLSQELASVPDLHQATRDALLVTPHATEEEYRQLVGLEVYTDGSGVIPPSWAAVVLGWLPNGDQRVVGYQGGLVITDPAAPLWAGAQHPDSLAAELSGVLFGLFYALAVVRDSSRTRPIGEVRFRYDNLCAGGHHVPYVDVST